MKIVYRVRCLVCGWLDVPAKRDPDRFAEAHMKQTKHPTYVVGEPESGDEQTE